MVVRLRKRVWWDLINLQSCVSADLPAVDPVEPGCGGAGGGPKPRHLHLNRL